MKNMRWNKGVDGYSAALILTERSERRREQEDIEIATLPPKSLWVRVSENVVRRIATLAPIYDDPMNHESDKERIHVKILEGPLADVMKEKLAALRQNLKK